MAVEPIGAAQITVTYGTGSTSYDLRFYGSEEFTVPAWWIGMFDPTRELRRTEVFPGIGHAPEDVLLWLRPITGSEVARRLVRLAMEAAVEERFGREAATAGRAS